MRRPLLILLAAFAAISSGLSRPRPALAHDLHTFGTVSVALGWLHEPAYVGFDNAVQVLVRGPDGKAITAINDSDLTVDLTLGNQVLRGVKLIPTADPDTGLGTPGEYEAHFIPTAPGNYTLHLSGMVAGQAIDETVTAGEKTFNPVRGDQAVEFPNTVPPVSDLSLKLDQVSTRSRNASMAAQNAADSGRSTATAALIVAIISLVLGTSLGILNAVAIRRRHVPSAVSNAGQASG